MSKENIDWLLEQWGIWARSDGTDRLYKLKSAMFADLVPHRKSNACLEINDDQAMQIEYVLSALSGFDYMNWVVIIMS